MGKMGRFGAIASLMGFTIGFWQGYSHIRSTVAPRSNANLILNSQIRISHAKELFGSHYSGSIVHRAELLTGVEDYILTRVEKDLPAKWKSEARNLTQLIISEAYANGMDPVFLLAVITRESRLKPEARGRHGEIGLMQIKPDTAEWIAKRSNLSWEGDESLLDPCQNIRIGVAYLSHLRKRYDRHSLHYISAYNMGPGRLQQLVKQNIAPKEYAGAVMSLYAGFYKDLVRMQAQRLQGSMQYRLVANF